MPPPFWYPPILAYHRVHPDSATDTPTVSPEIFRRQMALLRQAWNPIPLLELVERLEQGKPLDSQSVVVTFDDGTEDNHARAFPILKEFRIPATIFIIVHNIGRPGSLTAPQIQTMRQSGITFGSHTLAHDYLPSMPVARAQESLSGSKRILEEMGPSVNLLSYPGGGYTPEIARIAAGIGYRAACTTNRGQRRFPVDRWALRRITMHSTADSAWQMRLRCCGYYGLNRRLRPPA